MEYKVDHYKLKEITSGGDHYADMVVGCMSQYLGLSSTELVAVPGGFIACASQAAIQFLIDAKVLTEITE